MRKHKSLPVILTLLVLFLGTSLAVGIGVFNNGEDASIANDMILHDAITAEDLESEEITEEEAKEEDPDVNEEVAVDEEDADDVTVMDEEQEAEKTNEEKTQEKTAEVKTAEAPKVQTQTTETKTTKPEPEPENKEMARATVNGLNVRPDPSPNNPRIDVLSQGQTVEVIGEQNNWLQVRLSDGRTGWISGAYATRFTRSANGGGSLAGRRIAIDAGHGGTDPGAVGAGGLTEKEVNLDVSLRVAEQLRAEGAEVILTRSSDVFVPLTRRVEIAESARAEVFVSVHANAHPNRAIGGTETYYFGGKSTSNSSLNLAVHMQRELVGALGLRDIGVKQASFLVIRQTSMPSVLLELAFLSNAQEESLMRTDRFRQNSADAIVRALKDYFN